LGAGVVSGSQVEPEAQFHERSKQTTSEPVPPFCTPATRKLLQEENRVVVVGFQIGCLCRPKPRRVCFDDGVLALNPASVEAYHGHLVQSLFSARLELYTLRLDLSCQCILDSASVARAAHEKPFFLLPAASMATGG